MTFPSLFKNLNVESLHCEVCELAKHKLVPFPISNKRSPSPFSCSYLLNITGLAHVLCYSVTISVTFIIYK